jgi:hypothetical protein
LITATLALSGISNCAEPWKYAKAALCASIQSAICSVQLAQANDRLEPPMTATKMWASRTSPFLRFTTTGTVSPA